MPNKSRDEVQSETQADEMSGLKFPARVLKTPRIGIASCLKLLHLFSERSVVLDIFISWHNPAVCSPVFLSPSLLEKERINTLFCQSLIDKN